MEDLNEEAEDCRDDDEVTESDLVDSMVEWLLDPVERHTEEDDKRDLMLLLTHRRLRSILKRGSLSADPESMTDEEVRASLVRSAVHRAATVTAMRDLAAWLEEPIDEDSLKDMEPGLSYAARELKSLADRTEREFVEKEGLGTGTHGGRKSLGPIFQTHCIGGLCKTR